MIDNQKQRTTPDNITELKEKEVFVFGSNLEGNHVGGAARLAVDKFGAVIGEGVGPQGQSYAIPTMQGSVDDIAPFILQFVEYAAKHSDYTFLVTRIGCGIAGFSAREIAPLFNAALPVDNIWLPKEFWELLPNVKSHKGFEENLCCRDYLYEVGKEHATEGDIKACEHGFHACVNPLDVLDYYGDILHNRYCVVEQSGKVSGHGGDSKVASSKIKISAEIGFPGLFKAGIEWLRILTSPKAIIATTRNASGTNALNDNGERSAQIGSSGDAAQIGSSGDAAQIGSSGDAAQIGSSGYAAQIGSSGYAAQIGSSGDAAQIGSSGYAAQIGSSGDAAQIGSSGYAARIGSSGDAARIGSSGYAAQIGSSGDAAQIGSSGYAARIGSSGDAAQIDSTGKFAVVANIGRNGKAKASVGSWITLAEYDDVTTYIEEIGKYICKPKCVKTEFVDGKRIKGDTWYQLQNGEFIEVG